jgi:hypothetical protein
MTATEIAGTLDAALALAAEGRKCFPCSLNKRPATPHGFLDASDDPASLRELWSECPGELVGMATGSASGIDALDLDAKHASAREWWRANRPRLPETKTHRTRSGGLHLIFQHAPGLRCWTSRPAMGIDGRADGGYIIWWPATGLPVLRHAPPTPWPDWLLPDLRPSSLPARSESRAMVPDDYALAALVRKVAGATEGERNTITFWAGCRAGEMAASGLIGADTAAAVIANAALLAGLSPAEADGTAWSGVRTGLGALPSTRKAPKLK